MKIKNIIVGFIVIFALISCDKDKDFGSPAEEAIAISEINIEATDYDADATTICLLKGQELQLNYTALPAKGVTFPDTKWSSSNESVVSVSETGKIAAVNAGTAIVRITPAIGFGPAAATPSRTVRVLDRYVYMNSVSITGGTSELIAVGENLQLGATYTTESGDPPTFVRYKWSSSNPQVATVDDNGQVRGRGQGLAVITVTADDQNPGQQPSATTTVNVMQSIPVETFEIPNDPELERLGYGQEYQIKFNVTPADATISAIKWESDNEAAISVSNSGKLIVNCMDGAMAVITATAGDIVRRVNVAVAAGRLWYSFTDGLGVWSVGNDAVPVLDGEKTVVQMGLSGKYRGDLSLVTNGSGQILTITPTTYRYVALKIGLLSKLQPGNNSVGTVKFELYNTNPTTIGYNYIGAGNANNSWSLLNASEISTTTPNVLYYDLTGNFDNANPTDRTRFDLVQFKFIIADFLDPASSYDLYWCRTFKTLEELAAFVSAE
ncbi:MAG: Ig-like domain-containing protein [Dysgonamonadaceae bacterium]|jgi:uncharacterized protein YjdB|nr:Ig-like domain-containing protein [Dysgonamonadaceae bacterium]